MIYNNNHGHFTSFLGFVCVSEFRLLRFHCYVYFAGDPQSFRVQVTPQRDLPLDLYILIDLSRSMSEELSTIQSIANEISKFQAQTYVLNQLCDQATCIKLSYIFVTMTFCRILEISI